MVKLAVYISMVVAVELTKFGNTWKNMKTISAKNKVLWRSVVDVLCSICSLSDGR